MLLNDLLKLFISFILSVFQVMQLQDDFFATFSSAAVRGAINSEMGSQFGTHLHEILLSTFDNSLFYTHTHTHTYIYICDPPPL